ncbi:MAG: hypothetical protein HYS27_07920 [Deltaproteobacteria bacterium]|nr:hypothetical protein [Deltaproteobacteria bacterium]
MKIYGNPKSDRFGLYCTLIGALFGLCAMGMTEVSGLILPVGLTVFVALVVAMTVTLRRWDVMSEAPMTEGNSTGVPVRMPNFPVAAETEATAAVVASAWAASNLSNDTMLPQTVEGPKPAVETNALSV